MDRCLKMIEIYPLGILIHIPVTVSPVSLHPSTIITSFLDQYFRAQQIALRILIKEVVTV